MVTKSRALIHPSSLSLASSLLSSTDSRQVQMFWHCEAASGSCCGGTAVRPWTSLAGCTPSLETWRPAPLLLLTTCRLWL